MNGVTTLLTFFLAASVALFSASVAASQKEDLLTLRNTMVNMLEVLVEQGTLTADEARVMIERAETEAQAEAAEFAAQDQVGEDTVRVTYVPDVVKDELREQIMSGLREEVTQDVIREAQDQAWGVPGALPAWLGDVRWTADFRLRSRNALFDDGNLPGFYRDFQVINEAGGIGSAGQNALLNVAEDRDAMQARVQLGVDFQIAENWYAGMRLTTSNEGNPVSRNVTLGQSASDFEAVVDLTYLHYRSKYFLFSGGRIPNPFVHTELVWDEDVTFEGVAMTGILPFELFGSSSRAFFTGGAFPLEEVEFSSADKWLYGGQLGFQFGFGNGARLTLASGYYSFENVAGERNAPESQLLDFTAPAFVQKGNTLFDIRNDSDPGTGLFALASDFQLWDTVVNFDTGALFRGPGDRPVHVTLSADYVKNLGWDDADILSRTGISSLDERTEGYEVRLGLGMPSMSRFGDWHILGYYRHLERDAVIDAFTNSDFHRGGTDSEGWGLEVSFALSRNTWLGLTYLSANEIDGPPLGIDLLQVDLSAKF